MLPAPPCPATLIPCALPPQPPRCPSHPACWPSWALHWLPLLLAKYLDPESSLHSGLGSMSLPSEPLADILVWNCACLSPSRYAPSPCPGLFPSWRLLPPISKWLMYSFPCIFSDSLTEMLASGQSLRLQVSSSAWQERPAHSILIRII